MYSRKMDDAKKHRRFEKEDSVKKGFNASKERTEFRNFASKVKNEGLIEERD